VQNPKRCWIMLSAGPKGILASAPSWILTGLWVLLVQGLKSNWILMGIGSKIVLGPAW